MGAGTSRTIIRIKHGLWFEPLIILTVALLLGLVLPEVDRALPRDLQDSAGWARWAAASAGGARATLSTSATALATILAISVTATMVVIQLAAAMYGSRLLRRFLSDRPIRLLIGVFTGSVLYLIIALSAVRSAEEGREFVPLLSFMVGRLLTLSCLVLLVVFIHYTARSVQAATIVRRVAQDALISLRDARHEEVVAAQEPRVAGRPLAAEATGYLQVIEHDELLGALPAEVTIARLEVAAGDFILPSTPLVSLWADAATPAGELSDDARAAVRRVFATGRERTIEQDPGFAVQQLVDTSLRALSPGINDPTTAVMVVNELATVAHFTVTDHRLGGWAAHRHGSRVVWSREFGLSGVLAGLEAVVDAAAGHAGVLARVLEVLKTLRAIQDDVRGTALLDGVAARAVETAGRGHLSQAAQRDLQALFDGLAASSRR